MTKKTTQKDIDESFFVSVSKTLRLSFRCALFVKTKKNVGGGLMTSHRELNLLFAGKQPSKENGRRIVERRTEKKERRVFFNTRSNIVVGRDETR